MRFEPKLGEDFPLTAEVITAKTRHVAEVTRSVIALGVLGIMVVALLIAAVMSMRDGSWTSLLVVWGVAAAPLAWIGRYYFEGHEPDEDDDESSAGTPKRVYGAPKSSSRKNRS